MKNSQIDSNSNKNVFNMVLTDTISTRYYNKKGEWVIVFANGNVTTSTKSYIQGMEELKFIGIPDGTSVSYECLDRSRPAYTSWSYNSPTGNHYNDVAKSRFPIGKEVCIEEASSFGSSRYVLRLW